MFYYRESEPMQTIATLRASFDILQAFQALEPQRKLSLCDQLFHSGPMGYKNTVRLLWPQACDADAKKLESFLRRRMQQASA